MQPNVFFVPPFFRLFFGAFLCFFFFRRTNSQTNPMSTHVHPCPPRNAQQNGPRPARGDVGLPGGPRRGGLPHELALQQHQAPRPPESFFWCSPPPPPGRVLSLFFLVNEATNNCLRKRESCGRRVGNPPRIFLVFKGKPRKSLCGSDRQKHVSCGFVSVSRFEGMSPCFWC